MIRRWSCITNFNFHINSFVFFSKFNILKLLKSLNFKKYSIKFTMFKRHKLSRWKRRKNWLIYTQVIKYWVRDYNFNKKLLKSQYFDLILLNSIFVYNFKYIKKKNPLMLDNSFFFLINAIPKSFYYYYNNKFPKFNYFSFFNVFKNTNFTVIYYLNLQSNFRDPIESYLPISHKFENIFYFESNPHKRYFQNFNFIFYNQTTYNNLYEIYKYFALIIYLNIIKR